MFSPTWCIAKALTSTKPSQLQSNTQPDCSATAAPAVSRATQGSQHSQSSHGRSSGAWREASSLLRPPKASEKPSFEASISWWTGLAEENDRAHRAAFSETLYGLMLLGGGKAWDITPPPKSPPRKSSSPTHRGGCSELDPSGPKQPGRAWRGLPGGLREVDPQ